jgi:hypothetical protein
MSVVRSFADNLSCGKPPPAWATGIPRQTKPAASIAHAMMIPTRFMVLVPRPCALYTRQFGPGLYFLYLRPLIDLPKLPFHSGWREIARG